MTDTEIEALIKDRDKYKDQCKNYQSRIRRLHKAASNLMGMRDGFMTHKEVK